MPEVPGFFRLTKPCSCAAQPGGELSRTGPLGAGVSMFWSSVQATSGCSSTNGLNSHGVMP